MDSTNYSLTTSSAYKSLLEASVELSKTHLKTLLSDNDRNSQLHLELDDLVFDYSHSKVDSSVIKALFELAQESQLESKIKSMFRGDKINLTENRSVLHTLLRADSDKNLITELKGYFGDVKNTLKEIEQFSNRIRSGSLVGASGKQFKNFVGIGIGGSYLGVECVYQALQNHPDCQESQQDRSLSFLANICPIDFKSKVTHLNPEETLFIIISKTFTTSETMKNALACRNWVEAHLEALVLS